MEQTQEGEGIAGDTLISRAGDWLSADTGDGVVMLSPSTGRYVGISPTGGAIWDLLETPHTLAQLCDALARTYDVSALELRADVVQFVKGMVARGALAVG